jgi:hypothetical protein
MRLIAATLALGALACGQTDGGAGPDAAAADPVPLSHSFEPFTVAPGEEVSSFCQSWTLNNDDTIWVNAVEMEAGYGFHHSNWFWVPDNIMDGPDGTWRCRDRGYSEATAGIVGGVLFARSTQARGEIQQFQEGVVVPIPPGSRIVGGIHLLNASTEPLETNLDITLHPIAERDVTVKLSGLSIQYMALELPPRSSSVFTVECDVRDEHERQLARPVDFGLYYVLPHYHELGRRMTVEAFDEAGSEVVYETETGIGEPLGEVLAPVYDLTGKHGVRMSCEFENPRDDVVGWGIGDQEMCIFLAFTDSEIVIAGGVNTSSTSGNQLTVVDDVPHFSHACQVITAPANH